MKRIIFMVFVLAFGIFSIPLQSFAATVEESRSVSITVIDQHSLFKSQVIDELLTLQRSLIIPPQIPIPEENAKNGYLLVQMAPEYVHHLLDKKQGIIVGAYQDHNLVGYVLLTDISEFKELYEGGKLGSIETSIDLSILREQVGYIEQIAVKPGYSRRGIGRELMRVCQQIKPEGLVADVFLSPLKNTASLQFFSRLGFEQAGILHQHARDNFPYSHRTQIFFWNLSCYHGEVD